MVSHINTTGNHKSVEVYLFISLRKVILHKKMTNSICLPWSVKIEGDFYIKQYKF